MDNDSELPPLGRDNSEPTEPWDSRLKAPDLGKYMLLTPGKAVYTGPAVIVKTGTESVGPSATRSSTSSST